MKNKKMTSKMQKTLTLGLSALLIAIVILSANISVPASAVQSNDVENQNTVLQKLEYAKSVVTKNVMDTRDENIPTVATYIDEDSSSLVVVIDDKVNLPKAVYQERLFSILGDIPVTVEFGHMEFQAACTVQGAACNPKIGGITVIAAAAPPAAP